MMPFTRSIDPGLARVLFAACRGVAVVAALFCVAVATLLVANTVEMATVKPQESPALASLREQYRAAPNDELAGQIRALDLAARRSYFTRQWQNRTAAIMLIAGAALLVACLRIAGSLSKRLPKPLPGESEALRRVPRAARIALAATGTVLLAGALAAAVIADRLLPADPVEAVARSEARAAARAARRASGSTGPGVTPEMLANWPQFRGPGGNGIAGPQDPPIDWDGQTGRNIAWKAEVPLPGNNSPVVWGDRVFLSGADASTRVVYCWNARTGEHLWHVQIPTRAGAAIDGIDISDYVGWAASTLAVDGKAVYAVFPTGDLAAVDFNGTIAWQRYLGIPTLRYGYASSLALFADLLLVQFDQEMNEQRPRGGKLLAVDVATGKDRWSIERAVTSTWASPVVADTPDGVRVFLNGTPTLAAYDPGKRRELWTVDGMMGENGPSPAYAEGRVFAANQLLSMVAVDAKTGKKLWEVYDGRPDIASPVAGSGFVVMAASFGTVTALDPETGDADTPPKVLQQYEVGTGFSASPIIAGGRVYALDTKGVMRIFSADRAFDLLASPAIGEPTVATPAFVAGAIFIRGDRHLFCIRSPGATP
jgi:outer membrane protein assembly factor BamB